jgi:hypothetical protein
VAAEEIQLEKSKKMSTSFESAKSAASRGSIASQASKGGSKGKSKVATQQKHYYPSVSFSPSENLLNSIEQPHLESLCMLVDEVVAGEQSALEEYFASDESKSIQGRKHINESLQVVLSGLTAEVNSNAPIDVEFAPELSRTERAELAALLELQKQLQHYSAKLESYEEDATIFYKEHDIMWATAGGATVAENVKVSVEFCFLCSK